MPTIALYLLNKTLLSLLLVGGTMLLGALFHRKSACIHFAWVLVLSAMLAPVLGTASLPAWLLPARRTDASAVREKPDMLAQNGDHSSSVSPTSTPSASSSMPQSPAPYSATTSQDTMTVGAERAPKTVVDRPQWWTFSPQDHRLLPSVWQLVCGCWICGAFVYLLNVALRIFKIRRVVLQGIPARLSVQDLVDRLSTELNVRRPKFVYEINYTISPFTTAGVRGHSLVLPSMLLESLTPSETETVIMHELIHIRRRDIFVRWLEIGVRTVHWFNPLVWVACKRLRTCEELACDAVVASPGGQVAKDYAAALLKTVDFLANSPLTSVLVSNMGQFANCHRRLQAIVEGKHEGDISGRQRVLLSLATFPLMLIGFHLPSKSVEAQEIIAATPKSGDILAPTTKIPQVVTVFPEDGANDVPYATTIKVRFDRPMDRKLAKIRWVPRNKRTGFRWRGNYKYDDQRFEFSFPVYLEPGRQHYLSFNCNEHPEIEEYPIDYGFLSVDGIPAVDHEWSFRTREIAPNESEPRPRMTRVEPQPDTEVGLITTLRIRFDQPMDPDHGELMRPEFPSGYPIRLGGDIEYDAGLKEFAVRLIFPTNWNGDVQLAKFRAASGAPATPIKLPYRTRRSVLSAKDQEMIRRAGESEELLAVLKKIKRRYRNLGPAIVDIQSIQGGDQSWCQYLNVQGSSFAVDGEKFFGDVSHIMRMEKFQIGSNGNVDWIRRDDEITVCPSDQISIRRTSIGNPMNLMSGTIPDVVAGERLMFLGRRAIAEHEYFHFRSFGRIRSGNYVSGSSDWYFDAKTLLLAFRTGNGHTAFHYRLNDSSLPAIFDPPTGEGLKRMACPALKPGYTKRFVTIRDGTAGRQSLRWGQEGSKGSMSSGLN